VKQVEREKCFDKRLKPRKAYSGPVFFTTKRGFYEGRLKNYSRDGLFIESKASLSVGEVITIALPYLEHEKAKCKGQVMWCKNGGCGIELFRKRSAVRLKIVK
jgi:Tfp pilus assembly protein PilZ